MWRCRVDCPVYSCLATFGERGVFACIPGYKPCWKHTVMLSCVSWSPGKSPCFWEFDRYPSFGVGTVGERTRTYFVGTAGGATANWARTWPTLGKSAGSKILDCA